MSGTSYWIGLNTGVGYASDTYDEAAGMLVNMLTALLTDTAVLKQITHNAEISSAMAEIEVKLDEGALVGQAVLDMIGPSKIQLDKTKLSRLIKAREETDLWPKLTIRKKRVPEVPRRMEVAQWEDFDLHRRALD